MHIAVAGFMHESNTFNPTNADRAAFEAQSLKFGADLVNEWRDAHHEMGGFLEVLSNQNIDVTPIIMGWATPSGPVTDDVFNEAVECIIRETQNAKPDGLLLALHGAMVTQSHGDGDGELLTRLRTALGEALPIVVTHDFHGNVSQRSVDAATALISYQTNPHVDQRHKGKTAAQMMIDLLQGKVQPTQALAKPATIINIMVQDTSLDPLRSLLAEARAIEKKPGVLSVSLMAGFPYADVPQMGPSAIVVTNGQPELAQAEANRLADLVFQKRKELSRDLPDAKTAVEQALQSQQTPVVLVETGDNIGGGSAGDGTIILSELQRQQASKSVVAMFAPGEVAQCVAAGVGQSVQLSVGGKVDTLHGEPVQITGTVRLLHDGNYVETAVRHGGRRTNHMGQTALVEWGDGNLLVLTTQRHPPFSLGQLTCLDIKPDEMNILVVKAAIAYKAAYAPVAGKIIEVDTPGWTAVNPHRFAYRHVRRPMYPLSES